ncbi:hypothetical protein M3Y98_00681600 [Aphelenchoides besseyi]|nr:hypothetical protein M3Y98_00681600 [Aphelenchoides besseyi]
MTSMNISPVDSNVVAWQIDNFREQYRESIAGDEWASDLYALEPESFGDIEFYLKFEPKSAVNPTFCSFKLQITKSSEFTAIKMKCDVWLETVKRTSTEQKSCNFIFDANSRSCGWSLFMSSEQMSEFLNSTSLSICCRLPYVVCLVGSKSPQTTSHRSTISNFDDRFESLVAGDSWKSNCFPVNGLKNVEFKILLCFKSDTENSDGQCALHLETSFLAVHSTVRVHFELWIENTNDRLHRIAFIHDFVSTSTCGTPIYLGQKELHEFASNTPLIICCNVQPLLDGTTGVSKWKAYHQEIASLFNNKDFSDVRIEVEDKTFYVSKAIISAKSSVFRSMFSNSTEKRKTKIIKINEFKAPIIEILLEFIYTDKVNNLDEIASDLLPVAKHYKVKSLISQIQTLNLNTEPLTLNRHTEKQVTESATVDDQTESRIEFEDLGNENQNHSPAVDRSGNRPSISPALRGVSNSLLKFIPELISSITKTNDSPDEVVSSTSEDIHQEISLPIPSENDQESSTQQSTADHQDSEQNIESETSKIMLVMNELLTTERTYADILKTIDEFYYSPFIEPKNQQLIPDIFCGQSDVIFGNVYELRHLHCDGILPMFESTVSSPLRFSRFLMNFRDRLLVAYCKFSESRRMFDSFSHKDQIDCCQFFVNCQKQAGDKLPLSFHLLKPIQRLGQYPLLLQQLHSFAVKGNEREEVCREIQKGFEGND